MICAGVRRSSPTPSPSSMSQALAAAAASSSGEGVGAISMRGRRSGRAGQPLREFKQQLDEALGGLDLRAVAAALEQLELGALHGLEHELGAVVGNHAVAVAPDEEDGYADAIQLHGLGDLRQE